MSTPSQPHRKPGASGRTLAVQEPGTAAPSRALRVRAGGGRERFMRSSDTERGERVPPQP